LDFKDGYDVLALSLVTSIQSFEFVACSIVLMARFIDFHASYFSILDCDFQLDLEEGIQNVVSPSSKKLVSMKPFNF
jgi:hypothetical protein